MLSATCVFDRVSIVPFYHFLVSYLLGLLFSYVLRMIPAHFVTGLCFCHFLLVGSDQIND